MGEIIKFKDENGNPIFIKNYYWYSSSALSMDNGREILSDFMDTVYIPLLKKILGNDLELAFIDKVNDSSDQKDYLYCFRKSHWADNLYLAISTSNNNSSISISSNTTIYSYNDIETSSKTEIIAPNGWLPQISYHDYYEYYKNDEGENAIHYGMEVSISSTNAYLNLLGIDESVISPRGYYNTGFLFRKDDRLVMSVYNANDLQYVCSIDMITGKLSDISGLFYLLSYLGDGIKLVTTSENIAVVTDIFLHDKGAIENYLDSEYFKCVISKTFDPSKFLDNRIVINGHHYYQVYFNYFVKED